MRIISGKYKNRRIEVPKTQLRPTLDRTKETLFNILQFDIDGSRVLDLFAGSGNLGLEAHSRGAQSITFVDRDKICCDCIRHNCQVLECAPRVICADFEAAIKQLSDEKQLFDIVFVDPPYDCQHYVLALKSLCQFNLLADGAIVVAEHAYENPLPSQIESLNQYKTRKVGTVSFSFYVLQR